MTEKHLVLIFSLLFAASSAFLFWQNARELDPDSGKNWWVLSFADPQEADQFDFVIENHSDNTEFQYQIVANRQVLAEATLSIPRGETETVRPTVTRSASRTVIIVTTGTEKKEIYR